MAQALGVDTSRIYALTFGLGTMLAGLAGGLFALTSTIGPFYGMNYTPQAFITVVVGGGAEIISGLLASVLSLGAIMARILWPATPSSTTLWMPPSEMVRMNAPQSKPDPDAKANWLPAPTPPVANTELRRTCAMADMLASTSSSTTASACSCS